MSGPVLISRRALLAGLAGAIGFRALPGLAEEKPPSDRGIGGTGISGLPDPGHAIGFIGSIQRFGSIYVNGDRITYPADAAVTIDGERRNPGDLLIGQVVKTVASRRDGRLWTDRIDVTSEVVGAVEQLDGETMIVLGQRVALGTTGTRDFALGQRVAVSGLRRADGTIVARLVESGEGRGDQVVGLALFRGWTLWMGPLQLFGPDARYDGYRVVVRGRRTERGLMVSSIGLDQLPDGRNVRTLSIEAYVSRHGNEVQLGSGVVVGNVSGSIAQNGGDQPSVVSIDLAAVRGGGPGGAGAMGHGGGNWIPPNYPAVKPDGTDAAGRPVMPVPAPSVGPPGFSRGYSSDSGSSFSRGIATGEVTFRSWPGAGWNSGRTGGL